MAGSDRSKGANVPLPLGADDAVPPPASVPAGIEHYTRSGDLKKKYYERELARLQEELVKL